MPWCPRCDETFPEGPACPRCSARLIARERDTHEDTLETVPGLRAIKVSRRYLRALERLSAPKASSSRALALALVLLVFATGFLLGRVGSGPPAMPTVHQLPVAEPLLFEDVKGAVSYLLATRDPLMTIVQHDLYSGEVGATARFSPPIASGASVTTRVVSFGRSSAIILTDDDQGSWVAFAPHGRTPQGWVRGRDAAWLSETELLIRKSGGEVVRWSAMDDTVTPEKVGQVDQLIQSAAGAVVRRGKELQSIGGIVRKLKLPSATDVLTVSPDMTRAIIGRTGPFIWDGHERKPVHAYAGRVLGASYERSGERAALLLAEGGELTLAVVMSRGNAALKPLGNGDACRTAPAWDSSGRWLYVATQDGVLHAVEANGGRIEGIKTHGIGCGLAWLDVA